ncbi:phenylalanine--tRNA ligase subunit alpha [Legionella sp. W05-934-2]|jgi:phenylalanyl-tRNA synthetase alpha chain|uniref:phenylalanine--tRNA ligase subunit alpha n=1 Tax=Legionella sp. W05-934-2 TaxID=1198649 RepID=UPI003461A084
MQEIELYVNEATAAIEAVEDAKSLDDIRVEYLGKKGKLTGILKSLAQLSAEERPKVGQLVNEAKQAIHHQIEAKKEDFAESLLNKKLAEETIDVTLPGRHRQVGSKHPISLTKKRINEYFSKLGFDVVTGPEIETDYYNFEALNIPDHHPARAMHDTFYFGDGHLLRTHTSPVQIRSMEHGKPPFRLIAPGRVYRCDSDVTHTPMFHQVEGLVIDKVSNLSHLKELLTNFFSDFFGAPVKTRFRPSYFPFTEPSAEVDISCTHCKGEGCRSCKMTGWLEVLGCGMVHPNVLKAVNIDPNEYQGYAFGLGIDRLAMLYYGIDDLRIMFENDLAFLKQF